MLFRSGAGQIYFPDMLCVTDVDGPTLKANVGKTTPYKANVLLSVKIKNVGSADAGDFDVAFFANGKLVALEAVNGLTQNEEKIVTSSFKPVAGGHYEISTMVDGPRSRIVEFSESNNKQRIELDINMVYPDLELGDMQITVLGILDRIFPEFASCFSTVFGAAGCI